MVSSIKGVSKRYHDTNGLMVSRYQLLYIGVDTVIPIQTPAGDTIGGCRGSFRISRWGVENARTRWAVHRREGSGRSHSSRGRSLRLERDHLDPSGCGDGSIGGGFQFPLERSGSNQGHWPCDPEPGGGAELGGVRNSPGGQPTGCPPEPPGSGSNRII